MNQILHERERGEESQQHLKSNGEKFQGDCLTVMRMLFAGERLHGRMLEKVYDIDSRRLRDCYTARPDIIKKQWVLDRNNKTKYVEYWIEKFQPPTKEELGKWFTDVLQNEQPIKYKKGEKTAADFALKIIKGGKQGDLF